MNSASQQANALSAAVETLLRALVRLLLRSGITFQAFSEMAKRVFVETAMNEFDIPGKKQTISRAAILTGLARKDVKRIAELPAPSDDATTERYNRAARVVAGWVRDNQFTDADGDPLALLMEDGDTSFSELVRLHSGDVPARAILDELLRVGAVERLDDGRVHLLSRVYVPHSSDIDKIGILGSDVAELISTIDHNLQHGDSDPRFQRKVMYDNISVEAAAAFRKLSARNAQALIEKFDRWLAEHDRDLSPDVAGHGRVRTSIGIYYYEESLTEES